MQKIPHCTDMDGHPKEVRDFAKESLGSSVLSYWLAPKVCIKLIDFATLVNKYISFCFHSAKAVLPIYFAGAEFSYLQPWRLI